MKRQDAIDLLLRCFWDGMSVGESIAYISRCYWEKPTEKQVQEAQKNIKDSTGKDWN